MLPRARAGVQVIDAGPGFARPSEPLIGNAPGWTGSPGNSPRAHPGPHPHGQPMGGQVGTYDGYSGADPGSPGGQLPANPRVVRLGAEQETWNRPGIIGWNDQLQVRDRHAYWSRGNMRTGLQPSVPGNPPNPMSDGPPMPTLRTVNVSVNPQIGSDASRNQDDLTRPYTWLGQQDGSAQSVYGGVPGLWASYGNRGMPDGIHDPSNGEGGPGIVYSGPPHGLHSDTLPSGKQVADRYKATPQMRPVRLDRPDNSRIAGQSYSQTVQGQGVTTAGSSPAAGNGAAVNLSLRIGGRGWAGS